jgi:hypothetical protein
VLFTFLFFYLSCSFEAPSDPFSFSLQIEQKKSLSSSLKPSFSLSEPFSLEVLLKILSPFWKKNNQSDFGIRSYSRPAGIFGNNAYAGGVYDPTNNQIVFVPWHQAPRDEWHVYDCVTKTILSYPKPSGTFAAGAYIGGVYDPINNQIVFVPLNQAPQAEWHVYDCATKTILSYSRPSGAFANQAYTGGVYDPVNKQIIFVPHNQTPELQWHVYDCHTKTIISYNRPSTGTFVLNAYVGGVYDPVNHQIVFVPWNQAPEPEWHVYDCLTKTIIPYDRPSTGTFVMNAYGGGVYDPLNNQIVFVPRSQAPESQWHVYDCTSKTVLAYPRPTGILTNQAYVGGVFDPVNNRIVFVPSDQATESEWHVYDCETKTIFSYPKPSETFSSSAYLGGTYDPTNNQIVFIPSNQATYTQWHVFQNFTLSQSSRQLAAHYLFNKF